MEEVQIQCRCKDCEYAHMETYSTEGKNYCSYHAEEVSDEDFCCWGTPSYS